MNADRLAAWQAADAAFDTWLDLPESGREAWLAAQELSPPVRERLQRMIAAHLHQDRFLDASSPGALSGREVGGWTLQEELGRGGMAVVHRAYRQQGTTRQQAAVKILTFAALGAAGRERFEREAAILARLNHPNITPLIDSGTTGDGTCWMAMPLVEGERIDQYCDRRGLDAHAIISLGLQVCDAVSSAHRRLVVHRDLKPSNVLVDDAGHVRLLDFGIGQFTDQEGDFTRTRWRALTPGYAAPEQLHGGPPSTAIDIYGLGALLHRLLTGQVPVDTERNATTRPSLLVKDSGHAYHRHYAPLRSDLDRVLMKALAEEPGHRYDSVDALAADPRRWRDGYPVLARTPKLGYRLRKFAGRHRTGAAAGALLLLSLAGGIGATLWQAEQTQREADNARNEAQRARVETDKARQEAQRSQQVLDFLQAIFTSTEPATEKGVPDALELLEEGPAGLVRTSCRTIQRWLPTSCC